MMMVIIEFVIVVETLLGSGRGKEYFGRIRRRSDIRNGKD
jgi:hypothetical protein